MNLTVAIENPDYRTRRQDCEASDCMNKAAPMFKLMWHNWQMVLVGYCRPGAFPNHYLILLPWRPWYLCCLWCDGHGFFQQRQTVAPGNWSLCNRRCQQAACGQQERYGRQESCGIYRSEGMVYESIILAPWRAVWDHENWPGSLRNLPIVWEFRSLRLPPKTPPMSNKLSWRWQDRLRSAWGPPPSTTSPLCRSARARAFSLDLQADAAKFTNIHTSPGIISAWQSVTMDKDPWQYVAVINNLDGLSVQHALNNHNRCCDERLTTPRYSGLRWLLGSLVYSLHNFLTIPFLPGFHPALDGLRLLFSCCLFIFSIYCDYCWCSFFFFYCSYLFDSMPTSRCPIVFSRLGSMRFFLLEWINGENLMNVRSNIFIWLIFYQLEF